MSAFTWPAYLAGNWPEIVTATPVLALGVSRLRARLESRCRYRGRHARGRRCRKCDRRRVTDFPDLPARRAAYIPPDPGPAGEDGPRSSAPVYLEALRPQKCRKPGSKAGRYDNLTPLVHDPAPAAKQARIPN